MLTNEINLPIKNIAFNHKDVSDGDTLRISQQEDKTSKFGGGVQTADFSHAKAILEVNIDENNS